MSQAITHEKETKFNRTWTEWILFLVDFLPEFDNSKCIRFQSIDLQESYRKLHHSYLNNNKWNDPKSKWNGTSSYHGSVGCRSTDLTRSDLCASFLWFIDHRVSKLTTTRNLKKLTRNSTNAKTLISSLRGCNHCQKHKQEKNTKIR